MNGLLDFALGATARLVVPVAQKLARFHALAQKRRVWGKRGDENIIDATVSCSHPARVVLNQRNALERGCALNVDGQSQIELGGVWLQQNVTLTAKDGGAIRIGEGTYINAGCFLWSAGGVLSIGKGVLIGPNCTLSGANHAFENPDVPIREQGLTSLGITVEDDVWIGAGAVIADGAKVGQGSVVAAGAVVTRDVPPFAIVGGVPARVLKWRRAPEGKSPEGDLPSSEGELVST